MSEQVPPGE